MSGALARGISLLGISASIVTLIFAFSRFYPAASADARFGMSLLATLSGCFLIFVIVQEYRFSRKARYAEAMHCLYQAYRLCLEGALTRFSGEQDVSRFATFICDQLSYAFSLITGTRCSTCIKVIDKQPKGAGRKLRHLGVSTLCRDTGSVQRQSKAMAVVHSLDKNTDFFAILKSLKKPLGGVFICNNLPARHNYNNTSFEVYGDPKEVPIPIIRAFIRSTMWPLPYKSTIGAAIYPLTPSTADELVGFLFVDSASRNVFLKRYDVEIIRSVSSALHPVMMEWSEIVMKKKEDNQCQRKTP